jgi:MFS family permease
MKIHKNFILSFITAFFFFNSMSFFLLLPKFIHKLGGSKGEIGLIMGAPGFMSAILIPFTGIIAEKLGRKRIALIGTSGISAVSLLYLFIKSMNLKLFLLLRLLQGIFFSFSFVSCASFAGDFSPSKRKSEFLGYFGIAVLSPNMIGPWLGEKIIEHNFKLMFLTSFASGTIAFLAAFFFTENKVQNEKFSIKNHLPKLSKNLRYLLSLSFILGCAFSTTFYFLPVYSMEKGIEKISPFYTIYTLTAISTRLTLGSLSEKIKFHKKVSVLFLFISLALFMIARMDSYSTILVSAIIYGFGEGLGYPSINGEILNRTSQNLINTATGFYIGAFNAGTLIAPVVFGHLSQFYSFRTTFFITSFLPILGVFIIVLDSKRKLY